MSSFRNSRNSPSATSPARLLKRDQLKASGISTTLSAFCCSQTFQASSLGRNVVDADDLVVAVGGPVRASVLMQVSI